LGFIISSPDLAPEDGLLCARFLKVGRPKIMALSLGQKSWTIDHSFFLNELTGFSNFFLDRSQDIIGLLAWSGVTAELSKSSALSMEEAVNYTDMSLGVATVRTRRTGSR
jgi:hypothetical protein